MTQERTVSPDDVLKQQVLEHFAAHYSQDLQTLWQELLAKELSQVATVLWAVPPEQIVDNWPMLEELWLAQDNMTDISRLAGFTHELLAAASHQIAPSDVSYHQLSTHFEQIAQTVAGDPEVTTKAYTDFPQFRGFWWRGQKMTISDGLLVNNQATGQIVGFAECTLSRIPRQSYHRASIRTFAEFLQNSAHQLAALDHILQTTKPLAFAADGHVKIKLVIPSDSIAPDKPSRIIKSPFTRSEIIQQTALVVKSLKNNGANLL